MSDTNTAVAVFHSHEKAEEALRELQKSGFDMQKLSIVAKDYHTEQHAIGYYNTGDRMQCWGKFGAFWGGLWGMLFSSAFFLLPGLGPILVAGPLVGSIIAGLEGAAVMGGLSALGGAFVSLGIPEDSIVQYETELKIGKFLVIVHGTRKEVEHANGLLHDVQLTIHTRPDVLAA